MGIYFHDDALAFQDRDLEIPTHFFEPNMLDAEIVDGKTYTAESMDSISLMMDIPISNQSYRIYSHITEHHEEDYPSIILPIEKTQNTSLALDHVSFANPAREALRLATASIDNGVRAKLNAFSHAEPIVKQPPTNPRSYLAETKILQDDCPLWLQIEEAFADFIGMSHLKTEIFKQASLIQVQQLRAAQGIVSSIKPSRHMVFQGNPGTGKTTVARIIADIYFDLGLLATNNVVETDRSGLVGQYLGETAAKTAEVIENAIGGVLFIDEAYALTEGHHNEYGKESVNTLLKMMEDYREDLVVIVAGYENEMHQFIDSNPGLKSRFNRLFNFENYSPEELWLMLELMCERDSYVIKDKTHIKNHMLIEFEKCIEEEGGKFSNGRYIRNLFEKIIENQSYRVVVSNQLSKLDLMVLQQKDFGLGD